MSNTFFEQTEGVSDGTIYHEHDRYRLTTDEIKPSDSDDDLWGHYLYKKYTEVGQHPVSCEDAASLSTRDLETLLRFSFMHRRGDIATKTSMNCAQELGKREEK